MRWQRTCVAAVGVVVAWACVPSVGLAGGIWITLAAGVPGAADPTATSEFQFANPSGSSVVAVNQLSGTGTIRAVTGGGTTTFGGLGTPVLLNLADGSAYIAGGSPPAGATTRGPGGGSAGTPASAAPDAGGTVPSTAALLGLTLADAADGSRLLTASVTDGLGAAMGTGSIPLPDGGWWVLGLGPAADPQPTPGPTPDPGPNPQPGGDPGPPGPVPPSSSGLPEPATLPLAVFGLAVVAARFLRRRRPGIVS